MTTHDAAGAAEANRDVKIYDGATTAGQRSRHSAGAWCYTAAALVMAPII